MLDHFGLRFQQESFQSDLGNWPKDITKRTPLPSPHFYLNFHRDLSVPGSGKWNVVNGKLSFQARRKVC